MSIHARAESDSTMKEDQPLVSVIAVCYNHSRFVIECLESIRLQTYTNTQLIIIDDCSTDDSVSRIRDWIAKNSVECTFVARGENQGICKTFNEGLSHASGKYISIVATDDVWMPDKIERQVREAENLPEDVGVIYTEACQIDENGDPLPQKFIEAHREFSTIPEGDIFQTLLEKNFIPAMTTLVRRSCYDRVGKYDENLCYEDYDMWLRIAQHYKFVFLPIVSAKYRVVSNSLTRAVLHARSFEKLKSNFCLFAKHLTSGKDEAQKRVVTDHLIQIAEEMYKFGCKMRNPYLWRLARSCTRPQTVGMFVFSLCGIPYERFRSFTAWYESRMRRLT